MPESRTFERAYSAAFAVVPTVSDGVQAMSDKRIRQLLAGHDATTVLEAASTVLGDIEGQRHSSLLERFDPADLRVLASWRSRLRPGVRAAPSPVHPIAVLAATTIALAESAPAPRTDAAREELARRICTVALRLNGAIVEPVSTAEDEVITFAARAMLWRATDGDEWQVWSALIIEDLLSRSECAEPLTAFEAATGLTIDEWFLRGAGERATRVVHGARSWGGTDRVDPELEAAWRRMTTAPVEEAVVAAQASVLRRRGGVSVMDPMDLSWLAKRPVVHTADGRRFLLWLSTLNRILLPAGIAQVLADSTGIDYKNVAAMVGKSAENLLAAAIAATPSGGSAALIKESAMPPGSRKCDYLLEQDDALVGVEFTMMTPSKALSAGVGSAVDAFIRRLADKVEQAYRAFEWRDPPGCKRRVPVVVFASPTAVEPLVNERVHELLTTRGVVPPDAPSELMTCHAPDFLDLATYATTTGVPLARLLLEWRNSEYKGVTLDWWLAKSHRTARGSFIRNNIDAAFDQLEPVLTRYTSNSA